MTWGPREAAGAGHRDHRGGGAGETGDSITPQTWTEEAGLKPAGPEGGRLTRRGHG